MQSRRDEGTSEMIERRAAGRIKVQELELLVPQASNAERSAAAAHA